MKLFNAICVAMLLIVWAATKKEFHTMPPGYILLERRGWFMVLSPESGYTFGFKNFAFESRWDAWDNYYDEQAKWHQVEPMPEPSSGNNP